MKVLVSTARNIRFIWNDQDETLEPEIEAVLTVYSRNIDFVGAGMSPVERCETLRFTTTTDGARKLAEHLNQWANEADKRTRRITIEKLKAEA